jgi:hypothetical protein
LIQNVIKVGIPKTPEEGRKELLHSQLNREGGNPSQLLELLADVVESADWERLMDDFGHPLSFVGYIAMPYPIGIGWSAASVRTVMELRHRYEKGLDTKPDVAARMAKLRARVAELLHPEDRVAEQACDSPEIGEPGGRREGAGRKSAAADPPEGTQKNQGNNITLKRIRGDSPDYLTARIARDRPDIIERMRAGEFKSVRAAALEAGIVEPTVIIPLDPVKAARRLRRHFEGDRLAALIAALQREETP